MPDVATLRRPRALLQDNRVEKNTRDVMQFCNESMPAYARFEFKVWSRTATSVCCGQWPGIAV